MFRHSDTTARRRATGADRLVVVPLAVLVAALAGTALAQAPPVDLGTLGGTTSSASAVNASGQVVGESSSGDGIRAFSWTAAGGMVDLGTLGGDSVAFAVNASGQVVGHSGDDPVQEREQQRTRVRQ